MIMKKILPILFTAFLFVACSTDDATVSETTQAAVDAQLRAVGTCFDGIYGSIYVDVSQGINNPKVQFSADVDDNSDNVNQTYSAKLEIQLLSDCENLNSGTGTSTFYLVPGLIQNPSVNIPKVKLSPSQLPTGCYRWRFTLQGVSNAQRNPSCISTTQWYDAPLF